MLKALELVGFKSFADKTRFEFHDGITVVVGPNGSGKSNVVDAIKWVLGSQSAKSLRGSEMTDVIFNGSTSRSALNMAEVSLVLDNHDGAYGGEKLGNQVAITRRVYRSGEGEYLINGNACRRRDIRDLLAGTGIGTEAYSIIEQGKVDSLLQASPRDRRAIFEEAAGISRFRSKRQDAARRLARVEQNLLRLSDIVDEVESRLRSVRMQAGKAKRYRDGVQRLKELRTEIGVADWLRLTERIETVSNELGKFRDEDTERRDWIEQAESELPAMAQAQAEAQAACAECDEQLASIREEIASRQATLKALASSKEDLVKNLALLEEQRQAAENAPEVDRTDRDALAAKLSAAQQAYEQTSRTLTKTSEQLNEQKILVDRLTVQANEINERLLATQNRKLLTEQKLASSVERTANDSQQLASLKGELEKLRLQQSSITSEVETTDQDHQLAEQQAKESEQLLHSARDSLAKTQRELEQVRQEHQRAETELVTGQHRLQLIGELDQRERAASQSVRQFVGETLGIAPQAVADVLHVDIDTAPIIEAALGSLAEFLLVPSAANVLDHAGELPSGAKLMRLDWRWQMSVVDQLDLSGEPGVWGRADQFVDCEADYVPLVRRLLGRTWVVDTLATANRLLSSQPGLTFVTSDGDVLGSDGTVIAGRRDEVHATLTRRQDIEQLQKRIAQLTPRVDELKQRQSELEKTNQDLQAESSALVDSNRQSVEQLAATREKLVGLRSQQETITQRIDELTTSLEAQSVQLQSVQQDHRQTEQAIASLGELCTQLTATHQQLNGNLQEANQQQTELTEEQSTQRLEVAKMEQEVGFLETSLQQAVDTTATSQVMSELANQHASQLKRLENAKQQEDHLEVELENLNQRLQQCLPEREQHNRSQRQIAEAREQLNQKLRAARREIDQTAERKSQLEVTLAKLEHQRQGLVDRLSEEYSIDLPRVASQAPAEKPAVNRKQLEAEIKTIRDGLQRIGAVNVDALEELEEIENRFEAISDQYNDLSQAKASLERLMAKLNNQSRQLFLSTVETVRGHFQELFRRLFGGGDADLILEDSEDSDALECGVEIRACPPGKDTRTISLLSGGEKTMTCVALLLALFRSKPSPFCILDEVDAALDEANIGRFTGVLSDFLSSTQFVVITHSKKTMTGADTLYGVTMQESGISKQVSVRFDDVTDDGFIKPSASRAAESTQKKAA